ncbi:hypothetical protein C8R43DRAFT_977749, partial [Mycena crocata]
MRARMNDKRRGEDGDKYGEEWVHASPAPRRSGSFLTVVLGPNVTGSGKSSIACAICLARHWSPGAPRASTLGTDTDSIEIGVSSFRLSSAYDVDINLAAVGDAGAHGVPRYRDRAARAQ